MDGDGPVSLFVVVNLFVLHVNLMTIDVAINGETVKTNEVKVKIKIKNGM